MTMTEIVSKKAEYEQKFFEENERHARELRLLEAELASLKKLEEVDEPLAKDIQIARKCIEVVGEMAPTHPDNYPERVKVVRDAARDLAKGGKQLRTGYMGVKRYAHFGDQREDHPYGYMPRHGGIVFSVALKEGRHGRLCLRPFETEACVRVLNAMAQGKLKSL
jgi:hypothetical protein